MAGNEFAPGVTASNLFESDGSTNSHIGFSISGQSGIPYFFSGAGSPAFAPDLFYDFAFTGVRTPIAAASFSITNVAAGSYELYLYSLNGNGGSPTAYGNGGETAFVVNGFTHTVQNPDANSSDPSYAGFVLGGNYTLYSNLVVPTDGGTISGSFYDAGGDGAAFNGFQLVELPEPSSLVLLGIGVAVRGPGCAPAAPARLKEPG